MSALLALLLFVGQVGTAEIGGLATYYDGSPGHAAAGPTLRNTLGSDWRGSAVRVCSSRACVTTVLSDFCACGSRHGTDTLIDLDDADFAKLAPLSRGVVSVTVEFIADVRPPATDTEMWAQPWGWSR